MKYVETVRVDGVTPNTWEFTKLCEECLKQVRVQLRRIKAGRKLRAVYKNQNSSVWVRKLTVRPVETGTREDVQMLLKAGKYLPRSTRFDLLLGDKGEDIAGDFYQQVLEYQSKRISTQELP